ncbi:MAG: hypothetical protein U5R46_00885 [Gammaproteobacteria bacterium]|nr:hypothetical protein [Gammaproteobacteria bacterium]
MSDRFLVYSSIGDRTRFPEFWLNEPEKRRFDLWATYYGNRDDDPYRQHVDRYFRARGGKFQNFHKVYEAHRADILDYDAVFVVDDDIEIGTEGINHLFAIRKSYNLWIVQPAFPPHSRISHRVTARIPGALLHFTNFIEMCVPLFSRDALSRFMDRFDPALLAWGTDYFYMCANGIQARNRYAVVDAITCVNPDPPPGRGREINNLASERELIGNFEEASRRNGIRQFTPVTHAVVYAGLPDHVSTDGDKRLTLHDYPARSRRIAVNQSTGDRHECSVSGDDDRLVINDSALAILGLCDGRTSMCMMLVRLKTALGLSVAEMPALRASVERTLADYISRGLIRVYSGPHHAADLSADRALYTEKRACLAPEDTPRSVQVINLDRRQDRWLSFSTALAHAGAPEPRRLSAVDADDFPSINDMLAAFDDRLHPEYLGIDGFDIHDYRFRAKTACALSHRSALQNIVASGDAGWHLILEDDNQTLHGWAGLLDSLADTLYTREAQPDLILLSNRVGTAQPLTGINDMYGTDAYAVHSSICQCLVDSVTFGNRAFHINYSLDNHYHDLCAAGALDTALLENGPWINNFATGFDSDIEDPP